MKPLAHYYMEDQANSFWDSPDIGVLREPMAAGWRRTLMPDRRTPLGPALIGALVAMFPVAPRGYVTAAGYRRVWCPRTGRQRPEHVVVWERQHGRVPPHHHVYHVNGDRLDNRLDNLAVRTQLEARRLAGGCRLEAGQWIKPCRRCRVEHPIDHYYRAGDGAGVQSWCRRCCTAAAVQYKRGYARRPVPA